MSAMGSVWADGEVRQALTFSITNDVGLGRSVFVAGNHSDLGNWIPTGAVKLRWTAGNVWVGEVGLPRGASVEYKYISRLTSTDQFCNVGNVTWISPANLATSTAALGPAPYNGKTLYYFTGWTSVYVLASTDGVNFADAPLTQVSTGRTPGEYLYRGTNLGTAGGSLEFVLHNDLGQYDKAPYGGYGNSNYFTRLDAFVVQDGQIYNYWPAPFPSAPRVLNTNVGSTVAGIVARGMRIYLPRGYDQHVGKRYPVMYMQDGTNIFDPGGANGSWSLDAAATREISQGRLRETIVVAVDNIPTYRRSEYEPAGDTYPGESPGVGDAYLRFLMDNVRPTLDFNYRTLTDRRNTLVGGSSMGGLFSLYAAYVTNVFGGVLAMSPSITRATNFNATLWSETRRPVRIYVDTGTHEGQVGITPGGNYWEKPWEAYDIFLAQGYAANDAVIMRAGCGHVHNEAAWRERTPQALAFLLDVREEPNGVLSVAAPPVLQGSPLGALTLPTLRQHVYRLEGATDLAGAWQSTATSAVEQLPWGSTALTNPVASVAQLYLRAVAEPRP